MVIVFELFVPWPFVFTNQKKVIPPLFKLAYVLPLFRSTLLLPEFPASTRPSGRSNGPVLVANL